MTNSVSFKSIPEMYLKEKFGVKSNTLRKYDKDDPRFEVLSRFDKESVDIRIVNTKTGRSFTREVTDVTHWDDYVIISWRHE